MQKFTEFLSGIAMTVVGGVFLAASLICGITGKDVAVDPAWISVFICGLPIVYHAIHKILYNKGMAKISSSLLISTAMVAAIIIGDLFAAGEIGFIMSIGGILEDKTTRRARKGLKTLISLAPEHGRRISPDGGEEMVAVREILVDDIIRILPGETIPVDGEIKTGSTSIDQSVITGESLPVDRCAGDSVFCGTINCYGSIDIRATKVGVDSSLQKLILMVQEAENNKAPMQRIADRWATWLVPAALLIAIITYLVTADVVRAVTILVVFCPCALVLATPTAIMAAIGQATKHGVIIKSGDALERMGKVNCITFDKTGTLTHGNLVVSDIISYDSALPKDEVLALAADAESLSEHPLAKAIVSRARAGGKTVRPVQDFLMLPGKGVKGERRGEEILCGSGKWLEEIGVEFQPCVTDSLAQITRQGKAAILVAKAGKCVGLIALSDTLRENAATVVSELAEMNTQSSLLTGDNARTAAYFARQVGIQSVFSDLLPAQKVEQIERLQQEGLNVCMVGDGVNDAPALKRANVGVAMGTVGSDIAVQAADIALMGDDISKVPYLKRLSNATVNTIRISIGLSIAINLTAIVLSVLGVLNPTTGALVHNVGSVLVVLIAALLYDRKFI